MFAVFALSATKIELSIKSIYLLRAIMLYFNKHLLVTYSTYVHTVHEEGESDSVVKDRLH